MAHKVSDAKLGLAFVQPHKNKTLGFYGTRLVLPFLFHFVRMQTRMNSGEACWHRARADFFLKLVHG